MVSIVGKYPNLEIVPCIFTLALIVSEILTFYDFDLQKVGQCYGIKF